MKKLYKTGELAKIFNRSRSTIIFWRQNGFLDDPVTGKEIYSKIDTTNKYRYYSWDDIVKIAKNLTQKGIISTYEYNDILNHYYIEKNKKKG